MPLNDEEMEMALNDPEGMKKRVLQKSDEAKVDTSDATPILNLKDGDQLVYKDGYLYKKSDGVMLSKVGKATARALVDRLDELPDEIVNAIVRTIKQSRPEL